MARSGRRWEWVFAWLFLLGFVALLVGVRLWWGGDRNADSGSPPAAPLLRSAAVTVAPGIHLLGRLSPGAAYAVETSDGLVLIDSGLEANAATLSEQLNRLGLSSDRLRAILLTHVHADHSLGAEQLRKRTGAKVYAGRGDCADLRRGGPREVFFTTFPLPHVEAHPTTVDVELAGGETLEFGDTRFGVLATPGHTPGSVCYLLERPGLRALFSGDVVQSLSGAAKAPALGTYAAYLPPRYRGDARAFLVSLRQLRELPVPDLVLPGHPQLDPKPQSPQLTQERWQALLDRGIAEMERLVAHYDADGADFLDGEAKELLPGLHYLGDPGGAAVYCLEAASKLFLFDAPGGPGLISFLEKRFRERKWPGRQPAAVLLTSCNAEAASGLAALVKRAGCAVVASKAGREAVRKVCPEGTKLLSEEDLASAGWFEVEAIPLDGRGVAPMAYLLRLAGKRVLISGRIPVKPSVPAWERLFQDLGKPGGNLSAYGRSLDRLEKPAPDLWLPALPVYGQNANLYDRDWPDLLSANRKQLP